MRIPLPVRVIAGVVGALAYIWAFALLIQANARNYRIRFKISSIDRDSDQLIRRG